MSYTEKNNEILQDVCSRQTHLKEMLQELMDINCSFKTQTTSKINLNQIRTKNLHNWYNSEEPLKAVAS